MTPSATTTHHNQEETPTMTINEYWTHPGRRSHPIGCRCAPNGYHCEQAQAVAEEASERREMAGRYPCGEFAPHAAQTCPQCRQAWGYDAEAGW